MNGAKQPLNRREAEGRMAASLHASPLGRAESRFPFPHLRLRDPSPPLLALPWERPLGTWTAADTTIREYPVGPSRHLVRFVDLKGVVYAIKELPLEAAVSEYDVLRHLESIPLAAVKPIGLVESPEREVGVLVTEYLRHSLQYRRLLARSPLSRGPYRDRLLDAMAWLLVELHRNGVYWGDCSLANTLFRRDGPKIQAYLVDAETSEVHSSLSDGQRMQDLEILTENLAYGLADLAAAQGRGEDMDEAIHAAETTRARYLALWDELHHQPEIAAGDRHAITKHIRRLNEMGFAVAEVELVPAGPEGRLRLRLAISNRLFHARELQQRTGIVAMEEQARILLNDLREYRAWLAFYDRRKISAAEAAERWEREVLKPRLAQLAPAIGPLRDPLQAYCDVLEHKWFLSEKEKRDVGLETAIGSYLALGAPAPEAASDVSQTAEATSDVVVVPAAEILSGPGALSPSGKKPG